MEYTALIFMNFPSAHLFCALDRMCVSSLTCGPGSVSCHFAASGPGLCTHTGRSETSELCSPSVIFRLGPGEEHREVLLYLEGLY